MKNWTILDRGEVPESWAKTIGVDCQNCGEECRMPVLGQPMAQLPGGGIVFDTGPQALPKEIRCPYCRAEFVTGDN